MDSTNKIESNYYDGSVSNAQVGSPVKMKKDESKQVYLVDCDYYLVMRIRERTESNISFLLTLPYASDLENLQMKTNLASIGSGDAGKMYYVSSYSNEAYDINSDPSNKVAVNKPIVFNLHDMRGGVSKDALIDNYDSSNPLGTLNIPSLTLGRGYSVKVNNNKSRLEIFDDKKNIVGYIEYTLPSTMYSTMNDYSLGWYIIETGGIDYMTAGMHELVGSTNLSSYKEWKLPVRLDAVSGQLKEAHPISINGYDSLDCDCTIILALTRNLITIEVNNGSWWQNINDDTKYTPEQQVQNKDVNEYIKYSYMSSTGFAATTTYKVPGGLSAMLPSDYSDDWGDAIYGTSRVGEITPWAKYSKNIRSGFVLGVSDQSLYTTVEGLLGKTYNNPTNIGYTFFNNNIGIRSAMAIVANNGQSVVVDVNTKYYDSILKGSSNWRIACVPSGDSEIGGSEYKKVTMYKYPKDNASQESFGTFSFVNSNITFIQSYKSLTQEEMANRPNTVRPFEVLIGKQTNTRLYAGSYYSGLNDQVGNNYSNTRLSYDCPTSTQNDAKNADSDLRAILSGYKIVYRNSNGGAIEETYKHYDATRGYTTYSNAMCTVNLSQINAKEIEIYPIWELLRVYTINVYDSMNATGVGSPTGSTSYVLEGNSFDMAVSLDGSSYQFATVQPGLNPSSTTIRTKKIERNSQNYVFAGFTTSGISGYMYSTGYDENFDKYGLLRTAAAGEGYTVRTNNKNASADFSQYQKTIQLTRSEYTSPTVELYAVWYQYGYNVTYKHNDRVTSTLGYNFDLDIENHAQNFETAILVNYSTYLYNMPFNVTYGFNYNRVSDSDFFSPQGFNPNNYYNGVNSSAALTQYSLMAYGNLDDATIGFSLVHDRGHGELYRQGACMVETGTKLMRACCFDEWGNHNLYNYRNHDCKFCQYNTNYGERVSWAGGPQTSYETRSVNDTYHWYKEWCIHCLATVQSGNFAHTFGSWVTTKESTCTSKGSKYKQCSLSGCGHKITSEIAMIGHTISETIIRSATCCLDELRLEECSKCNYKVERIVELATGEHDYRESQWYYDSSLACNEKGSAYKRCKWYDGVNCTSIVKVARADYEGHNYEVTITSKSNSPKIEYPDHYHCWRKDTYAYLRCSHSSKCSSYKIRLMAPNLVRDSGRNWYLSRSSDLLTSSSPHDENPWPFNSKCNNCPQNVKNNYCDHVNSKANNGISFIIQISVAFASDGSSYEEALDKGTSWLPNYSTAAIRFDTVYLGNDGYYRADGKTTSLKFTRSGNTIGMSGWISGSIPYAGNNTAKYLDLCQKIYSKIKSSLRWQTQEV